MEPLLGKAALGRTIKYAKATGAVGAENCLFKDRGKGNLLDLKCNKEKYKTGINKYIIV